MAIEKLANKDLKQVYFGSCRSGNVSGSGGRLSDMSTVTFNKCDKKGHINKY